MELSLQSAALGDRCTKLAPLTLAFALLFACLWYWLCFAFASALPGLLPLPPTCLSGFLETRVELGRSFRRPRHLTLGGRSKTAASVTRRPCERSSRCRSPPVQRSRSYYHCFAAVRAKNLACTSSRKVRAAVSVSVTVWKCLWSVRPPDTRYKLQLQDTDIVEQIQQSKCAAHS